MADRVHLDYESASEVDLTNVGLDVYSSHPSTRILMGAYKINSGPVLHWQAHEQDPPTELIDALTDPDVEKWGFLAQFERLMTKRVLGIKTPIKGWRCAMVLAYMQCFMGGLAEVGDQIGLPSSMLKMKEGRKLIRLFSIPQRITKNQPLRWRNWETDPDQWNEFCDYNCQDVVTEEAIVRRLIRFPIPEIEWWYYELDQLINDRGIPADVDFIENVIWMSDRRKNELLAEMKEITGVTNPNSGAQLLPWLQNRGYYFDNLQKGTVSKAIGVIDDEDDPVYRVLRLRQWASRTSVRKAVTAKVTLGDGNRLRYCFQFAGASRTNRFSGRLVQPQNMTVTPKILDPEENDEKLTVVTEMIREGDYDGFDLMISEPMLAFSGCMRSMFRAPDGYHLLAMDLKSIESAVIAWVTDCERLLGVFHNNLDPYKDFGMEFYQKPYDDISRGERNICKPPALGCGFRLSGGIIMEDGTKTGLLGYAENMGVEMTIEQAHEAVRVYRATYPEIPDFWKQSEIAIRHVLATKETAKLKRLKISWMKPYFVITLPSGRNIYYHKPMMQTKVVCTGRMVWKRKISEGYFEDGHPTGEWFAYQEEETYIRRYFSYMGKDQKTTKWVRLPSHGGLITENIVQAIARDVLMVKLRRLHEEGFKIVMHAHDEGVALVRNGDNRLTLDLMRDIFREPIDWAPGLPLGSSGWAGPFYRK